jgi:Bacterial transcriptional activator domain
VTHHRPGDRRGLPRVLEHTGRHVPDHDAGTRARVDLRGHRDRVLWNPDCESAHRTLVRVHRAEGNLAEALRAYEQFRALLTDELGVAPTAKMAALVVDLPRRRQPPTGLDRARLLLGR